MTKMPTPLEVISEVEREADTDGIYSVGDSLARRIEEALTKAGFTIWESWRVPDDQR